MKRSKLDPHSQKLIGRLHDLSNAAKASGAKPISSAPGPGFGLFGADEPEEHEKRRGRFDEMDEDEGTEGS